MDLIGAKIMDEDTQKHNVRREGIISNALGFMNRLNGLFTSAAFYLVFVIFGFESGLNPGPQPDEAARFLLTVFPPILMVISFAFSFFINFDKAERSPVTCCNRLGRLRTTMALIRIDHVPETVKVNLPLNIILPDPGKWEAMPVQSARCSTCCMD